MAASLRWRPNSIDNCQNSSLSPIGANVKPLRLGLPPLRYAGEAPGLMADWAAYCESPEAARDAVHSRTSYSKTRIRDLISLCSSTGFPCWLLGRWLRCRRSLSFDRITPPSGYSRLISWLPRRARLLPKLARCPRNIAARNHDPGLVESHLARPIVKSYTLQLQILPYHESQPEQDDARTAGQKLDCFSICSHRRLRDGSISD